MKGVNGTLLLCHRRKTFVVGMITIANSVKNLAGLLFNQSPNPFSYILTYKLSQDHLELLFSCIRGKGGFNNNPDVNQFKSAIRKILLCAITASKHSNCLLLEDDQSPPIFSLKWTKNRSSVINHNMIEEKKSLLNKLLSYH